ncbi:hypothetical protein NPIL_82801 [Nephila pilipes]|uniref:Uncharacterized protein n=1 Tax=Nephila pilipes TaxID=299642 RepID=A0A8X6PDS9_NEPPI|nr:hypothetical protein NPIL_82801 [Nephila pilipes]
MCVLRSRPPKQSLIERAVRTPLAQSGGSRLNKFLCARGLQRDPATRHMLDSLIRVSRRVRWRTDLLRRNSVCLSHPRGHRRGHRPRSEERVHGYPRLSSPQRNYK